VSSRGRSARPFGALAAGPAVIRPSRRERNKHVCAGLALAGRAAAEGYVRCRGRVEGGGRAQLVAAGLA